MIHAYDNELSGVHKYCIEEDVAFTVVKETYFLLSILFFKMEKIIGVMKERHIWCEELRNAMKEN